MKTENPHLWKTLSFSYGYLLTLGFLFFSVTGSGQTTNISGVVNTYHSIIDIIPARACVRVDNTTGLGYGNMVVIAQMKGASIVTTNTATFGDTISTNNAGNYEIATICAVIGDSVFFFHDLKNTYTVADKVQLVKFGEYYTANVTGTVQPSAWDNATGKGGIVAIRTEEDLILNASISADAFGYRGGNFYQHSGTCSFFSPVGNGYAYDATSAAAQNGAYKGEGIADVPSNLDGARGAPANGGGGGNNHNNGGGGGGNLSAGGNGGGNYSNGPSGCTGIYAGVGGKALSPWGNQKIFLGGGGGAGHANNTVQPYAGGNGGGIVIILAENIIGNGHTISANGQAGRSTSYDGASGGGAGGTIIMHVMSGYTGALTIQANGGAGGNEDDDLINGRCYGAGGGGSGGRIYFNGGVPAVTINTNGGAGGINIDSSPTCNPPALASPGSAGLALGSYVYNTSNIPSSYCEFLLPVRLIKFEASLNSSRKAELLWIVANPKDAKSFTVERMSGNSWISLATITAHDNINAYSYTDEAPVRGLNIYRLRMIAKDNSISYSLQQKVMLRDNTLFSIYPNPAINKIFIRGKFSEQAIARITDLNGRLVLQRILQPNQPDHEISLPELPVGVYLVTINEMVEKLVIGRGF